MGFFNKLRNDGRTYDGQGEERKGMIDRIVNNGEEGEFVWKFPYDNISTGAQLVVHPGQEAVFVQGGVIADILGPNTHTLSANNIPILQKLMNLPFGGRTPFTAEVWFVNKAPYRNLKFGTVRKIDVEDPFYGITIPVGAFGEYGVQITDSAMFMHRVVKTQHLVDADKIIDMFKSLLVRKLSGCISKYVDREKVKVTQLNSYLDEISAYVKESVSEEFAGYGMAIVNVDVANINFDKDDPRVARILQAQTEGSAMDFESAALARKRAREQYTYQQERQFDVMQSAAANEGGAGQMMGAGMGLGMGVGIGGAMGSQMSGIAAGAMNAQPVPPPPPVSVTYHVFVNNVQQGPFNMEQLQQMVQQGILTPQTYVWTNGMQQWGAASSRPDLASLFGAVPPPPPPVG